MNTSDNLTLGDIKAAAKLLNGLPPPVVGIACHPAMLARIRNHVPKSEGAFSTFGTPILVDDRLPSTQAEAFFNEKQWRERCREQRKHDAAKQAARKE